MFWALFLDVPDAELLRHVISVFRQLEKEVDSEGSYVRIRTRMSLIQGNNARESKDQLHEVI